jgi:hypothetical protein
MAAMIKTKFQRPLVPCECCGMVPVRSGCCGGCRVRKCRGASIDGEACSIPGCGINQPRVLRWHRFTDETIALCANHSALAGRIPLRWSDYRDQAAAVLLSA